jgi:oxygen-dependent protoporphyrinogen oxidase
VTPHYPAVVVGGGISGLVCAYALRQAGVDVLLVEASLRPGGSIRSAQRDGYLLELGPQSFSGTPQIRALCRELGIEDQLLEAPARAPRYVLVDGALQQAPLSPPAFFVSSLFNGATKWSILRDVFGRSTPPAADESVAAFVRRKFSAELLDRLVGPFVSGIYAGDPERLSVRSAFPMLYEAEKAAGSIVRGMLRLAKAKKGPREKATLQTFREGNDTLVRTLAAKLGDALRPGATVTAIRHNSSANAPSFELTLQRNGQAETVEAKRVVLATPTDGAARLLRDLAPEFDALLSPVEYAPVAVVSLGYRKADVGHSLEGFGFLVPRSSGLRVLGTVWNSSLFPGRAPKEHALLTSFVGGATDPQAATLSAAELADLVHREIAAFLSIHKEPVFSNVEIYRRALPQYNLGHGERLAAVEKICLQIPGLWLTGNYLRGPAIGACVEQAQEVAKQVEKQLTH